MKSQGKQSMMNGAMILVASTILVKIIGVIFKLPMTDMLGTVGRGYFNSAYEVYTPIFSIAMSGLSVAVLKMVADAAAKGQYGETLRVQKVSKKVFFFVGLAGMLFMFAITYPYAKYIANVRNIPALLCIAPSIFFCYYMSAYRGYYEGRANMMPTGISQVIEALGKLCFGLLFIKIIQTVGMSQYNAGMLASDGAGATVFGAFVTNNIEANGAIVPWAAAGAVFGVTCGSIASTIFLAIYFRIRGTGFTKEELERTPCDKTDKELARTMIKIAIPMIISALVLNITNLIDTATIQARLKTAVGSPEGFEYIKTMFKTSFDAAIARGRLNIAEKNEVIKYLWGSYGMALDFKGLVPMITVQLGLSSLPALATAWTQEKRDEIKNIIETVLRMAMLIAMPVGGGMAVFARPILTIIYGRGSSSDSIDIVAPIMAIYGVAMLVIGVSTPITNMLQAIGRSDIPAKTVCVAAVLKIVCNYIFVGNYHINIFGALIGTVLFYVTVVAVNLNRLIKLTASRVSWVNVLLRPLACAGLSLAGAFGVYSLAIRLLPAGSAQSILNGNTFATLAAIAAAVIIYVVAVLLLKAIRKDDIITLPGGKKIVSILEKRNLISD